MHRGGTALLLLCLTVSTNGRLIYGEDLGTRLIAPSPVWRTFKDDFLPTFADFNQAALLFGGLRKADPYRLTNMDIYSNVLFVLVSELRAVTCTPALSQILKPWLQLWYR